MSIQIEKSVSITIRINDSVQLAAMIELCDIAANCIQNGEALRLGDTVEGVASKITDPAYLLARQIQEALSF